MRFVLYEYSDDNIQAMSALCGVQILLRAVVASADLSFLQEGGVGSGGSGQKEMISYIL